MVCPNAHLPHRSETAGGRRPNKDQALAIAAPSQTARSKRLIKTLSRRAVRRAGTGECLEEDLAGDPALAPKKRQRPSVGGECRRGVEGAGAFSGRGSSRFAAFSRQQEESSCRRNGDPSPVGRPRHLSGTESIWNRKAGADPALRATEDRSRVHGVAPPERQPLPVGRPCRPEIGGGINGEAQCVGLANRLYINVLV